MRILLYVLFVAVIVVAWLAYKHLRDTRWELCENVENVVFFIPFWKGEVSDIQRLYRHYTSMKCVVGGFILEREEGHRSELPGCIRQENDLRKRFVLVDDAVAGDFVLIADDDVTIPEHALCRMVKHASEHPTELVGLWGRNYPNSQYVGGDKVGDVDAVLTKGFVAERRMYTRIAEVCRKTAEPYGIPRLNGEDLYFNFLWETFAGKRRALDVNLRKIRDTGHKHAESISKRPNHYNTRSNLVHRMRHTRKGDIYKELDFRAYRIAVVMWYDDAIKGYADIAASINREFCDANGFDFIVSHERAAPDRAPQWERFPLMMQAMQTDMYDYVMWVDADAAFVRENNRDNELLKLITLFNDKDVLFSGDLDDKKYIQPINSGTIVLKTSTYGKNLLEYWMSETCFREGQKKYPQFQDLACIRHTFDNNINHLRKQSHIVPFGTFQTFGHLFPLHTHPLIRHFTNAPYLNNSDLKEIMLRGMLR